MATSDAKSRVTDISSMRRSTTKKQRVKKDRGWRSLRCLSSHIATPEQGSDERDLLFLERDEIEIYVFFGDVRFDYLVKWSSFPCFHVCVFSE